MTDKIWFERNALWDVVTKFVGWDYRLNDNYPPGPTYPDWWLKAATEQKLVQSGNVMALNAHYAPNTSHNTNCSMFTESVIIGTAMRHPGFEWTLESHNSAVRANSGVAPLDALEVYERNKMAVVAPDGDCPNPGDWCLCQGPGHSFFIIDYDKEADLCLIVEAQVFIDHGNFQGFVGVRGCFEANQIPWGIRLDTRPPEKWAENLRKFYAPTKGTNNVSWAELSKTTRFARLNLRNTKFAYPFCDTPGEPSPARMLVNNEDPDTGVGGSYAVSSSRTPHGGIHLFGPKSDSALKVSTMSPGYIVAARLPATAAQGKVSPDVDSAMVQSENWTGFVLVRHEFEVQKPAPASGQKPNVLVFYTLYMHRARPTITRSKAIRTSTALANPGYLGSPSSTPSASVLSFAWA